MALLDLLSSIHSLIALAGCCIFGAAVLWWGFLSHVTEVIWFFLRPFAFSGCVPKTTYDLLVVAWKAERQGKWVEALAAYDRALDLEPGNTDAHARRDALLTSHPELNDLSREQPDNAPSENGNSERRGESTEASS